MYNNSKCPHCGERGRFTVTSDTTQYINMLGDRERNVVGTCDACGKRVLLDKYRV